MTTTVLERPTTVKQKYQRPMIVKEAKMVFPRVILSRGKQVGCKQCSSCHGCR